MSLISISYNAPDTLSDPSLSLLESDCVETVDTSNKDPSKLGICSICQCPLVDDDDEDDDDEDDDKNTTIVKLRCTHMFHRACLENALQNNQSTCCVCRKPMKEPQGSCPSGTMSISMTGTACPGYQFSDGSPVDAITIHYDISSGTQKNYHYHPGTRFSGTHRTAYLPHCTEGVDLLTRLVYAWKHGLIFTVGTSLTSHAQNVTVWTSIHHKTSLGGGSHGFPDRAYLMNCNESLNALYVPDGISCRADASDVLAVLPPTASITQPAPPSSSISSTAVPSSVHFHSAPAAPPGPVSFSVPFGPAVPSMPPIPPVPAMPSNPPFPPVPAMNLPLPSMPSFSVPLGLNPPPNVPAAPSYETQLRNYVNSKPTVDYIAPDTPPSSGGTSPSGTMVISISQSLSQAFQPPVGVIQISYIHPRDVQKQYHPNPGQYYHSSGRSAVLPNDLQGLEILVRLMYSFHCGLSFTVGTSQTTGKTNSVLWSAAVPHKSSLQGGPFGFPDPHYIFNCHAALDRLNIPNALGCMAAMP